VEFAISEEIQMAKAWKIAPGERAWNWDQCRDQHCIALGWRKLKDYRKFKNENEIVKALGGGPGDGKGAAKSIWRFVKTIQPSDIVIANNGKSTVMGMGIIESEYLPPNSAKNPSENEWYPHARLVNWLIVQPIDFDHDIFSISTIHLVTPEKCRQIKQAYLKKYPKLKKSLDKVFDRISDDDDADDSDTKKLLDLAEQELAHQGAFDPTEKDARERILSSIVRRRGQAAFRKNLLAAFKGRCAISGCQVEDVLEAAHIVPYKGPKTNHSGNGLLLRADLHTLFDLRLLAVDAATMRILVSPKLAGTSYERYHGKRIRVPEEPARQPSLDALEQHRQESGIA
jgi:hypothetical protein